MKKQSRERIEQIRKAYLTDKRVIANRPERVKRLGAAEVVRRFFAIEEVGGETRFKYRGDE